MDFALLASDTNLRGGAFSTFSLENANADNQKCYGFGFLKQDRAINEEDLREFKMAKTSSCGEGVIRYPLQRSSGCNLSSEEGHHQMLSFSSPSSQPLAFPYYQYSSNAFARNITGINGGGMQDGVRGPFTPSQWMELEHQALIYKYITANLPIPSYLLNPIRKAFEAARFSALRSNPLGWSGFLLGFSNSDPEPGRCRRTDGKKWRCSRDAVVDQKYCERHINRGRHRSRKPVEGQSGQSASNAKPASAVTRGVVEHSTATLSKIKPKDQTGRVQEWGRHEFGLVCSDSLVNPLSRSASLDKHALRQFMDDPDVDRTQLSISIPLVTAPDFMSSTSSPATTSPPPRLSRELEMGLGVGNTGGDGGHRQSSSNWVPISWQPSSIGGPLGEVLHNTTGNGDGTKPLNFIDRWDNNSSPRLDSSPTGVLQRGAFVSLSNSSAASSPPHDACTTHCNRIVNPSLPAL